MACKQRVKSVEVLYVACAIGPELTREHKAISVEQLSRV